jgi:hypothetical protein
LPPRHRQDPGHEAFGSNSYSANSSLILFSQ